MSDLTDNEDTNPYPPPRELHQVASTPIGRFFVTLIPAFVIAALGGVISAVVGAGTGSVLVALIPTAVSLAISVWLVFYFFARGSRKQQIAIVAGGCLLSRGNV